MDNYSQNDQNEDLSHVFDRQCRRQKGGAGKREFEDMRPKKILEEIGANKSDVLSEGLPSPLKIKSKVHADEKS